MVSRLQKGSRKVRKKRWQRTQINPKKNSNEKFEMCGIKWYVFKLWKLNTLGGADFEIIPTSNIFPAHHLWAGSLHFPPRAGCFFHGRQVRPEKSEATRPIPVWSWVKSRPGRLRTSEIPMPLLVSSVVTHHCHHWPALPFRDWHPFTKPVLILTEEISSSFVPRGFAILYPILRSGT